jgi:hypothetical protein
MNSTTLSAVWRMRRGSGELLMRRRKLMRCGSASPARRRRLGLDEHGERLERLAGLVLEAGG